MTVCHLDLESFSTADLQREGLYRYAADPSTDLLVVCYAFNDEPVQTWTPGQPFPEALHQHIRSGGQVRAHNAAFERIVLNGVAGQRYGVPPLKIEQMVCTMAKMAAHGLPHSLEHAAEALGTHPKSKTGRTDMLYLCKPRADGTRPTPQEEPERFLRLYSYCVDDVEAERGIDRVVPDLSPNEQKVYELDQRMNDRGWKVDLESVGNAQFLIDQYKAELAGECKRITGLSVSQTGKLADWVREHGYPQLTDLQVGTVNAAVLDPNCPAEVKKVLNLFSTHNMKAVTKYNSMARAAGADGRLRGMFTYHGANTGRWCLTGDHEVMTPSGWQRLDEWGGGSLLCWDEATGKMDFARCEPNRFYYEGDMIEWDVERFAQVSTPDHKMPVVGKPGGVAVREIVGKTDYIPRTGLAPCGSRYSEAQIRFFVMAQADGHYKDGVWKFSFTKSRKEARCRALLNWLGLEFNYSHYPNDSSGKTRFVFTIHLSLNPLDAVWLAALGPSKEFSWELLYADHDVFFEELREWDGYQCGPRSIQYCTTNKRNSDFVQAKAHMANRQCSVTVKGRTEEEMARGWKAAYYCSIWLSNDPAGARSAKKTEKRTRYEGGVFCPTTPTGFFLVRRSGRCWITGNSSKIVQLQNLYRPKIDDPETAVEAFRQRDLRWLRELYDVGPMKVLASCVRSVLVAEDGHDLLFLDYAAIEARVNAWLWDQHDVVEAYRAYDAGTGPDLYELAYAKAFRKPVSAVSPNERFIGKIMILALGYSGGAGAFAKIGRAFPGFDLDAVAEEAYRTMPPDVLAEAQNAWLWAVDQKRTSGLGERAFIACDGLKRLWRNAHPKIVSGWAELETAARNAIQWPGQIMSTSNKRIMFKVEDQWLHARLPSGRRLSYFKPEINFKNEISFMGVDTYTRQWCRTTTFSGKLDENMVQAISRDLLVAAKFKLERAGYPIIGSVHDEAILEPPEGFGSYDDAAAIMCDSPKWAAGLPVAVEGHRTKRYRK